MKTIIPTFIKNLLDNTLKEKSFIILASRPSAGKTSLALQITSIAMEKEKGIIIFSLEMDKRSIFERIICSSAGTNPAQVRKGKIPRKDFPSLTAAISEMGQSSVWVDDKPAITIDEIISRIKTHLNSKETNPGIVIIDYAQLLRSSMGKVSIEDLTPELLKLKNFTKENNLSVILLSQMSRDNSLNDEDRIKEIKINPEIADYIWVLRRNNSDNSRQLKTFKPGYTNLNSAKLNFNETSLTFE